MYKKFYDLYSYNKFVTLIILLTLIMFTIFCFIKQGEYQAKMNSNNQTELVQSLGKCRNEDYSVSNNCNFNNSLKIDFKVIFGNVITFIISATVASIIIYLSEKRRFSARESIFGNFIFLYSFVIIICYILLFFAILWINNIDVSDITDNEYYYLLYSILINTVGSLTIALLLKYFLPVIKPVSSKNLINNINDDIPKIGILFDKLNEDTMSFEKKIPLVKEIIKLLEDHNKYLARAILNNDRLIKSIQIRHKEIYRIIKDLKTLNKTILIEDANTLKNTRLDNNYFVDKAKRKQAKSRLDTQDIIDKLEKNKEYLEQIEVAIKGIENLYKTNEVKR